MSIIDSLFSVSIEDSLSANQGRNLRNLIMQKFAVNEKKINDITSGSGADKSINLPTGHIIKIGEFVNTSSNAGTITFDEAFPNHCYGAFMTLDVPDGSGGTSCRTEGYDRASFNYSMWQGASGQPHTGTDKTFWLAIGY